MVKLFLQIVRQVPVPTEEIRGISKIVDKVQGKEVEEDASLIESLTGASISAAIKIPKGLVTFGTLLADIFRIKIFL